MSKRKLSIFILVIVLLVTMALPAGAAASTSGADTGPLVLRTQPGGDAGVLIEGLTVSRESIPVLSMLSLIRSTTGVDAVFTTEGIGIETPAGTGIALEWTNDDGTPGSGELVVAGDVLGTGVLGLSQVTRMAEALAGTAPLEGAYLAAADLVGNDRAVTLTDLVAEAQMLLSVPDIDPEQAARIVQEAVDLQSGDGSSYSADVFHVVQLHKGDIIYGMLPGQSAFYTDKATVEACSGSYVAMYEMLQMLPHPEFGYREQLGLYTVEEDIWVAAGYCLANSEIDGTFAGPGGGYQFVIPDFEQVLELTDTVDLRQEPPLIANAM